MSLITSQLDFLEEMCYNKTDDFSTFDDLEETIGECQKSFLNGTTLRLTLDELTTTDPKEFFKFYAS
jgi:hypothetical protein